MSNTRPRSDKPLGLGSLLFGAARRELLSLFLLHPEYSAHVRELGRVTGRAPGTLLRELSRLADAGVLTRRSVGNQVHFQANPACPIYEELRGVMKKTSGIADVLREALDPLRERIHSAFIYGSIARGDERRGSDLDLMIVGDVTFADVVGALQEASNTLRREINPHLYPPRELKRRLSVGEPFLERVMEDRKIFIIGGDDDLGKLAPYREAEGARRQKS